MLHCVARRFIEVVVYSETKVTNMVEPDQELF